MNTRIKKSVLGWHFTNGHKLRDGSELPLVGVALKHTGHLVLCRSGYHASERLIDALKYAMGSTLSRVNLSGGVVWDTDKCVASERTILWTLESDVMDPILHEFACWCAEQALHRERKAGREPDERSWSAIDTKRKWLRKLATDTEWAAAWAAARSAAGNAARYATGAAAGAATEDAVWAAARDTQNTCLESLVYTAAGSMGFQVNP